MPGILRIENAGRSLELPWPLQGHFSYMQGADIHIFIATLDQLKYTVGNETKFTEIAGVGMIEHYAIPVFEGYSTGMDPTPLVDDREKDLLWRVESLNKCFAYNGAKKGKFCRCDYVEMDLIKKAADRTIVLGTDLIDRTFRPLEEKVIVILDESVPKGAKTPDTRTW